MAGTQVAAVAKSKDYHLAKYEFVNGKDYPIYMMEHDPFMFQTTNQVRLFFREQQSKISALFFPASIFWGLDIPTIWGTRQMRYLSARNMFVWRDGKSKHAQVLANLGRVSLWLFDIAMENGRFIDGSWWQLMDHLPIQWWFSMAMLNNQRVYRHGLDTVFRGWTMPAF